MKDIENNLETIHFIQELLIMINIYLVKNLMKNIFIL
uniref:Uncharacterized protein n=1 Tax=Rhodomela confervoides TaxID=35163 RepID=A0A1Z1M9P6_RHOCN|nr:hypothetical protein [Rhodomela confervoides]ARW62690.1 hypothetical protein [Rhodomela confervoides]